MRIALFGASGKLGSAIEKITPCKPISKEAKDLPGVDVAIDVSSHLATKKHLEMCLAKSIPLVIGTTGHSFLELDLIEKASLEIPIFKAANFSVGIATLKAMLSLLKTPPLFFDIIEKHPASKKDAPSGTALELAHLFQDAKIHSIRSHNFEFSHECLLSFGSEEICIRHTSFNREPFAKGALKAAKFLVNMPKGLYNMEHLIKGDSL